MRVRLTSLGCKLNQAEIEAVARRLVADGHQLVEDLDGADVHVVNSCTVTAAAARDSRKVARRGTRLAHVPFTVLTGCWASEEPAVAGRLDGVDLVVENRDKERLVDRLYAAVPELAAASRRASQPGPTDEVPVSYVSLPYGNTRAALKVEDGCNMRCAFCIIPSTRGRQRSRPPEDVVDELRELVAAGCREVVVTGVQISAWRWQGLRLHDLVDLLVEESGGARLRLTSIAPWQLDGPLRRLFEDRRVCRHVHLSLQSGCTRTLRRMRRPYTASAFETLVEDLRARVPGLAVTSDVIVGFPGETEDEFESSLAFVERLGFARTHVFTYSERRGTLAANMPDPVPHPERRERAHRMLAVADATRQRFERSQCGARLQVLWERPRGGRLRGHSDNYLEIWERPEGAAGRQGPGDGAEPLVGLATRAGGSRCPSRRQPGQFEEVAVRYADGVGLLVA
ncbi:MAG: MiaB/RimO family radical SAM methylthiotransferase [Acidobacteria bacterium]|nr:MAG: MiaB/RimO family radical SAM methylthiotransferase [Acidobacteriota bacterium]REK01014.1 MAG: MiaB/RimO family radical SAM methylthiotransferase [Acidobacteriota bacterium]